jgi:hypothetical protein
VRSVGNWLGGLAPTVLCLQMGHRLLFFRISFVGNAALKSGEIHSDRIRKSQASDPQPESGSPKDAISPHATASAVARGGKKTPDLDPK